MGKILWTASLALLLGAASSSFACQYTTTTGVDYGGAAYNCEAILQGNTNNCHPSGNLWVCGCYYSCEGGGQGGGGGQSHVTHTTGPDYGSASSNCEVILQGRTSDCHPDGNMWVCTCYY